MRAIISFVTGRRTSWITLVAGVVAIGLALILLPRSSSPTAGSGLPASADSQRVDSLLADFPEPDTDYALIVWNRHDGDRLTAADNAAIASRVSALAPLDADPATVRPELAANRTAILVELYVDRTSSPAVLANRIDSVADAGLPADLQAQLTGTVASRAKAAAAATGPDLALVLVSVIAALLLLALSRRPVLWLAQVAALGAAGWLGIRIADAVYAGLGAPLTADARDLLFGVVVGIGACYCCALSVRLRAAGRVAGDSRDSIRGTTIVLAAPALVGAAIVAVGMLALLFARGPATRAFGVGAAIAVAALAIVVVALLPALMAVTGRALLWPGAPVATEQTATQSGAPGGRPLLVAVIVAAVACLVALDLVDAQLSSNAGIDTPSAAQARAQHTIDAAYGTGYGNQAVMLAPAFFAGETSTVAPTTLAMNFATVHAVTRGATIHGRTELIVALDADPASARALSAVSEIRRSLASTGGLTAHTLVGGADAAELDRRAIVSADRGTILAVGIGALALLLLALAGLLVRMRRSTRASDH